MRKQKNVYVFVIGLFFLCASVSNVVCMSTSNVVNEDLVNKVEKDFSKLVVEDDNFELTVDGDNYSFFGHTVNPNSSWITYRIQFDEPHLVNRKYYQCEQPVNTKHFDILHEISTQTNLKDEWWGGESGYIIALPGRYLHINNSLMDFERNKLRSNTGYIGSGSGYGYADAVPPDDWQYIFIKSPAEEAIMNITFDFTTKGNVTIYRPVEGSTSFYFENEDFNGNFITKKASLFFNPVGMRTIMRNAYINLSIKNNVILRFSTEFPSLYQDTKFKIIDENNDVLTYSIKIKNYQQMSGENIDYVFMPLVGGKGNYSFHVDSIAIGGFPLFFIPQHIFLTGGDYKYPTEIVYSTNGSKTGINQNSNDCTFSGLKPIPLNELSYEYFYSDLSTEDKVMTYKNEYLVDRLKIGDIPFTSIYKIYEYEL